MSIPSFSIPVLFWYGSYGSSTKYVFFFHSFVTILSRRFDCCVLQNTCCRSRYFCWEYLVHNFLFLPALVLIHSPELSLLNLFKTSWLDSGLPSVLLHLIVSQSQCILVLTVCTNGLYVCKTGLLKKKKSKNKMSKKFQGYLFTNSYYLYCTGKERPGWLSTSYHYT